MAFADQTDRRPSLRIALAVGLLHAGVGAALLATFAGGAIRTVIHNTLQDNGWTYMPPPPPPKPLEPATKPRQTQVAHESHVDAPDSPFTLPTTGPLIDPGPPLPPLDDGPVTTRLPPEPPVPQPSFTPLRATPRGDPGQWITRSDYPAQALRAGWSGVTRFRLAIATDGRVTDCTVTGSSGHDVLDATTCDRITHRARFTPARDDTGAATSGVYVGAIRWELTD